MDNKKKIEIPFGAFDSELIRQEINIPNGFKAVINGNKIILTRVESEDEKIRKALIRFYTGEYGKEVTLDGIPCTKIVTWLEKQGEQKSIWHNEDEEPKRGSLILLIMQSGTPIVAKIIEPNHTFNHGERWAYIDDLLEKQDKQKVNYTTLVETGNGGINALVTRELSNSCDYEEKPVGKVEPKFKVGDEIKTANEEPLTITKIDEKGYWSEDLFICGFDDAAMWELVEQKPAWSEEDETKLRQVEYACMKFYGGDCSHIDWLRKVTRPQTQWKPSDEQMKVCKEVYADILSAKGFDLGTVNSELNRLEEQLKKLSE